MDNSNLHEAILDFIGGEGFYGCDDERYGNQIDGEIYYDSHSIDKIVDAFAQSD